MSGEPKVKKKEVEKFIRKSQADLKPENIVFDQYDSTSAFMKFMHSQKDGEDWDFRAQQQRKVKAILQDIEDQQAKRRGEIQGRNNKELNEEMNKIRSNVLKTLDKQTLKAVEAQENKSSFTMFTNKLQALNYKIETYQNHFYHKVPKFQLEAQKLQEETMRNKAKLLRTASIEEIPLKQAESEALKNCQTVQQTQDIKEFDKKQKVASLGQLMKKASLLMKTQNIVNGVYSPADQKPVMSKRKKPLHPISVAMHQRLCGESFRLNSRESREKHSRFEQTSTDLMKLPLPQVKEKSMGNRTKSVQNLHRKKKNNTVNHSQEKEKRRPKTNQKKFMTGRGQQLTSHAHQKSMQALAEQNPFPQGQAHQQNYETVVPIDNSQSLELQQQFYQDPTQQPIMMMRNAISPEFRREQRILQFRQVYSKKLNKNSGKKKGFNWKKPIRTEGDSPETLNYNQKQLYYQGSVPVLPKFVKNKQFQTQRDQEFGEEQERQVPLSQELRPAVEDIDVGYQ